MEKGEWRFLLILSHGDGGGYSVITLLSYSESDVLFWWIILIREWSERV